MRAAPLLLALLALAPGLALAQGDARPNLSVVKAPEYTVGDTWTYQLTSFARDEGGNETRLETNQTARVAALDAWQGQPTYRLSVATVHSAPAGPDDPTRTERTTFTNRTLWLLRGSHAMVHIEEVEELNEVSPFYRRVIRSVSNVTFHEPMDSYQFPIIGAGAGTGGDEWLAVTNTTTVRNVTYILTLRDQPTNVSYGPERVANQSGTSSLAWLRQDRLGSNASALDVVVLQAVSGDSTVFDFWAPAAGNLARREVLNAQGQAVQILQLTSYAFAKPPDLAARPSDAAAGWLPLAGAAALGLAAAGAGLLLWKRRPRQGPPPAEAPEAVSGARAGSSPPEPPS